MKFKKSLLQDLVFDDAEEGYEVVEDNIVDNSRWSIHHEMIFKTPDGKYYKTIYSEGATEYQDESPYEYDHDLIDCVEVIQKEVMKTVFVEV